MEPPSALRGCVDVEISSRSVSFEIVEEDSHCTNLSLTQGGIITMCNNDRQASDRTRANQANHLYHETSAHVIEKCFKFLNYVETKIRIIASICSKLLMQKNRKMICLAQRLLKMLSRFA